jgi:hypothetical protein
MFYAKQHPEQGCFTVAVSSDQTCPFPPADGKGDLVKDRMFAV